MPDNATSSHPQLVAVLGRGVLDADEPIATADDLGLTRGDGCFDATLVTVQNSAASALHLDRHVERLGRSSQALDMAAPDPPAWRELVDEALSRWASTGGGEAVLKLVVTRGREVVPAGQFGYLTVTELAADIRAGRDGLTLASVTTGRASDAFADAPWLLGGVKTVSYAVNMAVGREAAARGADDALFTSSDGYALEGPTSALLVHDGTTWATTPTGATGILESITLRTIFEGLEAGGEPTVSRLIALSELPHANAVWMLSSVRGVAPVTAVDGRPVPTDEALTARLNTLGGFAT